MRAWLVCLAALIALPVSARPFKDMCAIVEPMMKLSGLKYVKPSVKVKSKDPKVQLQSVFFTIEAKAGTIRVPVAADGAIAFPVAGPLCAENPNMESSQPPGSMEMTVSVEVSAPPAQALEYRVFTDMKAEWDEAISRQDFMYRVLAPGAKAGHIAFEPGRAAFAEVRLPQGARRFMADDKGQVRIPFDDAWKALNPVISLSEMPRKVSLAFK